MMFKVRGDLRGQHYHLQVFVGPDKDHLAMCGELCMRPEECETFTDALEIGLVDLGIPSEIVLRQPQLERLREMERKKV